MPGEGTDRIQWLQNRLETLVLYMTSQIIADVECKQAKLQTALSAVY